MIILLLFITSWIVLGLIGAILYHTSDFDLRSSDLPLMLLTACLSGYIIFIVGVAALYKGVLIKKRE